MLLSDAIMVWRQWEALGCVIPCNTVDSHPIAMGPGTPWGWWVHAHHCCGESVSLFWEILQPDLCEEAFCRATSTPTSKHTHPSSCPTQELALPCLCLLWLALLLGQRAGAKAPHRCQSWALPACSAQEEPALGAHHSTGFNCPHLMAKDRVHTWDLLGSCLRVRS